MSKTKNTAFTLVELIVVITILAILGTIAFIALQGYSTDARDSARISDISSMKSSVELLRLDSGKYPIPTNGVNITYSGGTVWTQGTFGESVYTNVDKLNKIPKDPLTDKEYAYSVTISKNEYEISGLIEGDTLALKNLVTNSNAGNSEATAIVTGNYNGMISKTLSGTLCNILSLPSIIVNDTETSTDLGQIIASGGLVYNGYKNLPSTFKTSKFKVDGGFNFTSNQLITYNDNDSCNNLLDKNSNTARLSMLQGISNAYTGTILQNEGKIKGVIEMVSNNSGSNKVINLAGTIVNNSFGGDIAMLNPNGSSSVLAGNSCNSTTPGNATTTTGSPTSSNQSWQSSNPDNPCYFTCDAGFGSTGTDCIASTDCNSTISELTLGNSQTWSCLNLGATSVWDGTIPNNCFGNLTNCNSGYTWVGDYYQWGKSDTSWGAGNMSAPYNGGWEAQNDNKWGGATTTSSSGTYQTVGTSNQSLMQGPCPNGWHVPTAYEWKLACNEITGTNCVNNSTSSTAVKNKLKLPPMGYRYFTNGSYMSNPSPGNAYYLSSTPFNQYSLYMYFDANNIYAANGSYDIRAIGINLRCLKN